MTQFLWEEAGAGNFLDIRHWANAFYDRQKKLERGGTAVLRGRKSITYWDHLLVGILCQQISSVRVMRYSFQTGSNSFSSETRNCPS